MARRACAAVIETCRSHRCGQSGGGMTAGEAEHSQPQTTEAGTVRLGEGRLLVRPCKPAGAGPYHTVSASRLSPLGVLSEGWICDWRSQYNIALAGDPR